MTELILESEAFARTGNIAAEGMRNLMGRPALGLLQTVVRESVQNSIDAAMPGTGPSIHVRCRTLASSERAALEGRVLIDLPGGPSGESLRESLAKERLRVLEICDFGTLGLTGPTRADVPSEGGGPLRFVNFLRNVGSGRSNHQGGGTYGYGKTVLYSLSKCALVIVDSVTSPDAQRRLMACHIGKAYDGQDRSGSPKRFTGRHWWGIRDPAGCVEPAIGDGARELSVALGLPLRNPSDSGTSVLILDPGLEGDDSTIAANIVETLLWNLWPRMTDSTPIDRKLVFSVEVEGASVEVPRPEDFPPLDLFSQALAEIRHGGKDCKPIISPKYRKTLGTLAIKQGMKGARWRDLDGSPIPAQASHIALMRPVELVVKYLEGRPYIDQKYEWAGVFICSDDDEVEAAFAAAEPPAHDDWVPNVLEKGRRKSLVNIALNQLRDIAGTHAVPRDRVHGDSGTVPSLARVAAQMGRLLDGSAGQGPGHTLRKAKPKIQGTNSPSVSRPSFCHLEADQDGSPIAVFEATVRNDGLRPGLRVRAEPRLVMEGAGVQGGDLPSGYHTTVLGLHLEPDGPTSAGHELKVGDASGRLLIRVKGSRQAAVTVHLTLHDEVEE
jgi:hypothetical protein